MKKVFLGLVALLTVGSNAHATSLMANVRLQFQNLPKRNLVGATTTTISVYSDGQVVESRTAALPRPLPARLITRLNAYQMDRIERLIDRARFGRIVTDRPQVLCMALSMFDDRYTADNGRIFLQKSAMCEVTTYNQSLAARQLVQTLNNLRNLANQVHGVN